MSLLLQTVEGPGTHRPGEVRLLDEYPGRFSEREQAVRDLLTAQAFAEFPGRTGALDQDAGAAPVI
jgi:hypothetical protein